MSAPNFCAELCGPICPRPNCPDIREFRGVALSAVLSGVFLSFLLLTQQLGRIFSLVGPRSGKGYLWHTDCPIGFYAHLNIPFWPYWNRESSWVGVLTLKGRYWNADNIWMNEWMNPNWNNVAAAVHMSAVFATCFENKRFCLIATTMYSCFGWSKIKNEALVFRIAISQFMFLFFLIIHLQFS